MANRNLPVVVDQACLDEAERRNRLRVKRQQERDESEKQRSIIDDRVPGSRFILTARVERKSLPTAARVAAILGGAPALGETSLHAWSLLNVLEGALVKRSATHLDAETRHCRAAWSAIQKRAVLRATAAVYEKPATQENTSTTTTMPTAAERLRELRKYAYMHERNLHHLMEAESGENEDGGSRTQQVTTAATHAEIDKEPYSQCCSMLREPMSEDAITELCLARCTTRAIAYELKAQKSNAEERLLLEARGSSTHRSFTSTNL
ncbi:hypothetical protein LTS10_006818 [Elasticomyces elasticus]|nr:hypothetical protein LTS10_006818 [Elasticomyces elasticus]